MISIYMNSKYDIDWLYLYMIYVIFVEIFVFVSLIRKKCIWFRIFCVNILGFFFLNLVVKYYYIKMILN